MLSLFFVGDAAGRRNPLWINLRRSSSSNCCRVHDDFVVGLFTFVAEEYERASLVSLIVVFLLFFFVLVEDEIR